MGAFGSFFLSRLPYLLAAVVAYFCGCFNGAIFASKVFFHDDVRTHGSGNAGLTNFYRTYGARYALMVIVCDMLKAVVAVGVAVWLGSHFDPRLMPDVPLSAAQQAMYVLHFKYLAGLFCVIGHMFPCTAGFKGGKGILCSGTLLLLLDWRIALAGWGAFVVLGAATRYVSLGSVAAAISLPFSTYFVFHDTVCTVLGTAISLLVLWAHRGNIKRLLSGTESKFRFHVNAPKPGEEQ